MTKHEQQNAYLESVVDAAAEFIRAEVRLYGQVSRARSEGRCTWEDVGNALGITRQSACERFSKPPRGRLI